MKRRARTGGKKNKGRRRKTPTAKRRTAPAAARPRRPPNVDLQEQLHHSRRELKEAREQQTATSEVLKVISSSPGDLQRVFEVMLENATRICEARSGNLLRYEDGAFAVVALHNAPAAFVDDRRRNPLIRPTAEQPLGRVVSTKQTVHVADLKAEPSYIGGNVSTVGLVELAGARTLLSVPLLKDNEVIGAFNIYRQDVRPFTDKQIELVQNFAAQAVIAIENTRLLNELRESLQQQTATSEVLQVISSSPGELEPVFNAMLENAIRICEAKFGTLFRFDGKAFHFAAGVGAPSALARLQKQRGAYLPASGTLLDRVLQTKKVAHSADYAAEPIPGNAAKLGGARSTVAVPMLKDNELVGAILIYRREVRPFTDKQIGLVANFAAQAVIAIENTRLLNELRQRTDDLTESLEQQTATSEVLRVISSSPGELEPVFRAMLENAIRICAATCGTLYRYDGEMLYRVASVGTPPALVEYQRQRGIFRPEEDSFFGQFLKTKTVVHLADDAASPTPTAATKFGGARSIIAVPMLKDETIVGLITMYRQEVRPFTEKQIELVRNFAAQAVIAIENTRLLNELRESLQQQTATADVLKVISRSTFDLKIVLNTLVESAARLCNAYDAVLLLREKDSLTFGAHHGPIPMDFDKWPITRAWTAGRAVADRKPIHVHDLAAGSDEFPEGHAMALRLGHRTILSVPLLREDEAIGCLSIRRTEVRPFTDKQVELARTFADQAVIAIENIRLFDEVQARTKELTLSLEQQTATSEVLQVISSSPGQLDPVFQSMLENATRICEAHFGNMYLRDGEVFRLAAAHNSPPLLVEERRRNPLRASGLFGRMVKTKQVVHVVDLATDQTYLVDREQGAATGVDLGGIRTMVVVPMLKDDELAGAIVIYRQEVRAFTDKQIELVQNFAAQAVIAIENTRLLNELRQRTDDLTESLEQQTATSEVLKVISSSPGELKPVFEAILANATRICEASFGNLMLFEGDAFRRVALHNAPAEYLTFSENDPVLPLHSHATLKHVAGTKKSQQIADMRELEPTAPVTRLGRARTLINVPMLREDELVGVFAIFRQEVRPFTDKQIELLENFAAQAVIAIENTRLLSELRESLQQQTATADVLRVISRSTFDLQKVFETLVESAAQLCRAEKANIWRLNDDDSIQYFAAYGFEPDFMEYMHALRMKLHRGMISGRAALEGRIVHIHDVLADPEFTLRDTPKLAGFRTALGVPLMREGKPIGGIFLTRREVDPFSEQQIKLVSTFADQAVIAIENVRLFDEIQDKSRQLAEASQHKSQFLANMSHELRTPLNAILGYTELIADGVYGAPSEKMHAVLKRVESNGKHLLGLINAVLDLSKIEAGQLTLDLADYSLGDVTQTVYGAVEALAIDKKLAFKAEVAPDLPRGRGDERRLAQVLLNLVGNAIKFTDAGEVVITAAASNGSFNVSVRDTGPGISAADQAKLFQEFQQADNSLTRQKGGTGLGLAISKRIIEMHGGRIRVESEVGRGSTFFVTLPVHA